MIEDLPVLESETIEPKGVDLSLYRRIGEEVTKVVKHKPGMLYVKGTNAYGKKPASFAGKPARIGKNTPAF